MHAPGVETLRENTLGSLFRLGTPYVITHKVYCQVESSGKKAENACCGQCQLTVEMSDRDKNEYVYRAYLLVSPFLWPKKGQILSKGKQLLVQVILFIVNKSAKFGEEF